MTAQVAKKPKRPDFPSDCPPFLLFDEKTKIWRSKSIKDMSWEETEIISARIDEQFIVLHNLPVLGSGKDKIRPDEYMHETFWGLRKICNEIHWRQIQLNTQKLNK